MANKKPLTKANAIKSAAFICRRLVGTDSIVEKSNTWFSYHEYLNGKWCHKSWKIEGDNFSVEGGHRRHPDGRVRTSYADDNDVEGLAEYTAWLRENYPDVAADFKVPFPCEHHLTEPTQQLC